MRTAEAYSHLLTLSKISADPLQRVHAAEHIIDIAAVLGPSRVQSELLSFLADAIEGPPSLPLLPPTPVEESPDTVIQPSPVIEEILDSKRRPSLAAIGATPEARAALFKAIVGTSETDAIHEILATQLRSFIPRFVPKEQAVLVIGLLCQLGSSADVGVRNEAVLSILHVLKMFSRRGLLRTGCVDLFLGMATSDIPYKKASVAYLLPTLLKILLTPCEDEESDDDLWPLQAEIVKLFFDIASNSATIARRAFALNFPDMTTLLFENPKRPFLKSCVIGGSFKKVLPSLEDLKLSAWQSDVCLITYVLTDEASPELRGLAIAALLFVALVYFIRLVIPSITEAQLREKFPALATLLLTKPSLDDLEKKSPSAPESCPRCQFGWTGLSSIEGMFSLAGSSVFELFSYAHHSMRSDPLNFSETGVPDVGALAQYQLICQKLLKPLLTGAVDDDWMVRVVLVDSFPLLFELFLAFLPLKEAETYLESVWLGLLIEDEHLEVRTCALQRLPLHAWLFGSGCLRGLFDESTVSADCAFNAVWMSKGLPDLPRFLDRCGGVLRSAVGESESKLRLAATDVLAHFLLVVKRPEIVAQVFITPFLSLLRDSNHQVVLSALASLRVLTLSLPPTDAVSNLVPKLPVGIRSGLRSPLIFANFLPFRGPDDLNSLDASRSLLAMMSQATLPAIAQCLVATTTTAPPTGAEVQATIIPLWRVRCAILHVMPTLNVLLNLTDMVKLKSGSDLYSPYALWMQHVRTCLQDTSASIVRLCAAEVVIKLLRGCDPRFAHKLVSPVLVSARAEGSRLASRFAVPALAESLAKEWVGGPDSFGFSADLWREFLETLQLCRCDKVATIRAASDKAYAALEPLLISN